MNTLRGRFAIALWPKKFVACKVTCLLLVDKGELGPCISIVKKILVNCLRQTEGGIPQGIDKRREKYAIYTGPARVPINYFRRTIRDL
eukprot:16439718-Heterocapsa_arctica.AAC.1